MANAIEIFPTRASLFDTSNGLLAEGFTYTFYEPDQTTLKDVWLEPTRVNKLPNPYTVTSTATTPFLYGDVDENYYVEVKNESDDITDSFTLYTKTTSGNASSSSAENYIPNGQFMSHFVLPADDTHVEGEIRDDDTTIAIGGWHYVRSGGSGSKDVITFERLTTPDDSLSANPRYAVNIENLSGGTAYTRKDLEARFSNVRRFASDEQEFTFSFVAKTGNASTQTVKVYIYKYFGNGGSPFTYTLVQDNITVGPTFEKQVIPITYGTDTGLSVGDDDDDYVGICIQMPLTATFNLVFTDCLQYINNIPDPVYPVTTDRHALALSSFQNSTPKYDGSNLYVPLMYTNNGIEPDLSEIGKVVPLSYEPSDLSTMPFLEANGDKLKVTESSSLGIPYSRLWNKYYSDTLKLPIFGTGLDYVTTLLPSANQTLLIFNNTYGSASQITITGGGFTNLVDVHTASAVGYDCISYKDPVTANTFQIESIKPIPTGSTYNSVEDPLAGTSTFTIVTYKSVLGPVTPVVASNAELIERGTSRGLYSLTAVAASALANPSAPGLYFTFATWDGSAEKKYYVWYGVTVGGTAETDPAPAGYTNAIKVNVEPSDSADIVAQKTSYALLAGQVSIIDAPAASAVTGTPYISFQGAGGIDYYVWLDKDGGGADPAVSGTGIQVKIDGADTNIEVAGKIQEAMNKMFFALPDLRGAFIRGHDNGRDLDLDAAIRYSLVPGLQGDQVGTWQMDEIVQHIHTESHEWGNIDPQSGGSGIQGGGTTAGLGAMDSAGGKESRPYNISVKYLIRY